jgi:predicted phosphohydrolase
MAIFAIGDLHLSLGTDKPMDVFHGWEGYLPKLEQNWRRRITPQDTVVLAGDTSWAMKLEDTAADFTFLQSLPGQKWMLKGNHDYWWTTQRKMDAFLSAGGYTSLHILHNGCCKVGNAALCGTRGWSFEDGAGGQDEKILAREAGRLRLSLQAAGGLEKLVFLHYPPVYPGSCAEPIISVMREYGVKRCWYGHLHGSFVHYAVQGNVDGIEYRLISADALNFCPIPIGEPGGAASDLAENG